MHRHLSEPVVLVRVRLVLVLTLLGPLAPLAGPVTPVVAAMITVTTTSLAVANDGTCTLIEAIIAANTDTASGARSGECPAGSGADTITLQPGATYTLTRARTGSDGPTGLPVVTSRIAISGQGAIVERSGAADTPAFRVLQVGAGGDLTLDRLTLRNGQAPLGYRGGGINNVGTLTLSGSTVSGNATGRGEYRAGDGGGIANYGTLTLTDSTVSGNTIDSGYFGGFGGGIFNVGTLTLTNSTVSGNAAGGAFKLSGDGGGIYNGGTLTLTDSTVSGNAAGRGVYAGRGGGIFNCGFGTTGTLTLTRSTVSGNAAGAGSTDGDGGGIYNCGEASLTNSTVSGNRTVSYSGDGGGIANSGGSLTLTASTISDNATASLPATGDGGGLSNDHGTFVGTVMLTHTIIAGNRAGVSATDPSADCTGLIGTGESQGHNLVGRATGCPVDGPGDRAVDPADVPATVLGPLADNGGPTRTHAPRPGSPALDAGDPAVCAAAPVGGVDQRGEARPPAAGCDIGAVERSGGTAPPTPTPGPGAAPAGALTWYFAEGYTGAGFDEFLTIQNPNAQAADLRLTYFLTGAPPVEKRLAVAANSRATVAVHEAKEGVGRGQAVSAKVESLNGVGVVVERPMYFTYQGSMGAITGGHVVLGVPAPRRTWLFAEGWTGAGFDEFLTILNPHPSAAPVTITYFLTGAAPVTKTLTVPAASRYTIAVHETRDGVGRDQAVSALVTTTHPDGIVVERPIYFDYRSGGGIFSAATGGHVVLGAAGPQTTWYFPDGNTTNGYDEYLTLLNPSDQAAQVTLTYYVAGEATPRTQPITVPATSRATVAVHKATAGVGQGHRHGTKVESTNGVELVVERPTYFRYGRSYYDQINGGHDIMGASAPATTWLFAEGYTGAGFDEELVLLNPHATAAAVTVTYQRGGGTGPVTKTLTIPPVSRFTVVVHAAALGVGRGEAVSARVETSHPDGIVVERPMYFVYGNGVDGGHTALGYTPAPNAAGRR